MEKTYDGAYCRSANVFVGRAPNSASCALAISRDSSVFSFAKTGPDSGGCYAHLTMATGGKCDGGFYVNELYDSWVIRDCEKSGPLINMYARFMSCETRRVCFVDFIARNRLWSLWICFPFARHGKEILLEMAEC